MSTKSNSRGRRRLGLEQLDARICLSVNPVFSEGVLYLGGSRESDTILIVDNSRGVVSVQDGESSQRWEFRGVDRIAGDVGDGDDTIRFTRRGSGDSPIPELDIKAGDGDDEVAISLFVPAVQKVRESAARVHVDLGEGNDQLRVNANGVANAELDIAAGNGDDDVAVGLLLPAVQKVREAAARVNVDLGTGDDLASLDTLNFSKFALDLTAGAGDDVVQMSSRLFVGNLTFGGTSENPAQKVNIDLGDGDNTLTATVEHLVVPTQRGVPYPNVFVSASIRGDTGDDELSFATHGVSNLALDLRGGDGDDHVSVRARSRDPFSFTADPRASGMVVDLGDGDDHLVIDASGFPDVSLELTAGAGDDEVAIGLLVPAVQKVRESAARVHVDLGAGNDQLRVNANGVANAELDIAAGDGDDDIALSLHLVAVQKIREAAARVHVDLGAGDDHLMLESVGYADMTNHLDLGDGDDTAVVRHRMFSIVDRTRLSVFAELGAGSDTLLLDSRGYRNITADIDTGPAGDGRDLIRGAHFAPGAGQPVHLLSDPLDGGTDRAVWVTVGFFEVQQTNVGQTRQITIIQDL